MNPMSDPTPRTAETKRKSRIPPLVWIVVALLVGWLVVAVAQRGGTDTTPQGGTTPMAAEGPSIMPPASATPEAPATPGGVVNPETPPPSQ